MEKVAETNQTHFNLSGLQPWHIIGVVALGACAIKPDLIWVIGGMAIAGYLVWNMAEKKRVERENAARLTALVNLCAPVVVSSISPTESVNDLMERVEQWKRDLRDSGNPYASIIPVVPYPYSPMMFGMGQLSWAWPIYQRMVGEEQHIQNLKWYDGACPAQLKAMFASQVMPAPPKIEMN